MQDYSINEIIEKISADTIIIPRSVAFRKDVYEESKTLFGVVFTECVNDLRSYGSFIDGKTVGKIRKRFFPTIWGRVRIYRWWGSQAILNTNHREKV